MGIGLLRVAKLQDKWRVKISQALEKQNAGQGLGVRSRFKLFCERYAMFILPFITVLREGLEAVVFIGGVGLGLPATSFPLAVVCGLLVGALIGYAIYKSVWSKQTVTLVADIAQGRQYRKVANFPDHLHVLFVPRCSW
jgi:high-affinity iron transporter